MGSGNNRGSGKKLAGRHPPTNAPWSGGCLWPWMALWAPWAIPLCPHPSNS